MNSSRERLPMSSIPSSSRSFGSAVCPSLVDQCFCSVPIVNPMPVALVIDPHILSGYSVGDGGCK